METTPQHLAVRRGSRLLPVVLVVSGESGKPVLGPGASLTGTSTPLWPQLFARVTIFAAINLVNRLLRVHVAFSPEPLATRGTRTAG